MLMNQIAQTCRKAFEQGGAGGVLAEKLGLADARLFARFKVGYADAGLLEAVPAEGGLREALGNLGLVGKDGSLMIAGCLTAPILDRDGRAIGIVAVDAEGRERRFPAALPLYGLNPAAIAGQPAIFTDSALKALLYIQAGISDVVALGEVPNDAEEAFLRLNRPQKAYLDARGRGVERTLLKLEVPCLRLEVEWPADAAKIEAAMKSAEPIGSNITEASSIPGSLDEEATAVVLEDSLRFRLGGRDYELQDLSPGERGRMRVQLRAVRDDRFHLDTLDLYAARARVGFAKPAAGLFGESQEAVEADLCLMIRKLEAVREAERGSGRLRGDGYAMTADEEADALELLKSPNLLDKVALDLGRLGYIGEEANKKLAYLIAVSRKLKSPLCGAILSRAGSGKSSLMDAVAETVPDEDLVRFTRITPQALYYAEPGGLRNKVLMSGEDEGLSGSDYVLRELISSKKICLAVPLTNGDSGKLRTVEHEVEGPIALLFSTTKPALHFENATRLFTLSLDESPGQTRQIFDMQRRRRTFAGLEDEPALGDLKRLHQNAQRLLKNLLVVNPYAPYLDFPAQPLEMRREHEKYLSLIDAVALLHQHQRVRKSTIINGREVEYVEAAVEDIEIANALMTEMLGASTDELSRPSRDLLDHIKRMVEGRAKTQGIAPAELRFNRRDIREFSGWSDSQIKSHIGQLEDLEYLLVGRTERGKMFRYELAHDGKGKRLPGLTDPVKLRALARGKVRRSGMVWRGPAVSADPGKAEISKTSNGKSLKVRPNPAREGIRCVEDAHA